MARAHAALVHRNALTIAAHAEDHPARFSKPPTLNALPPPEAKGSTRKSGWRRTNANVATAIIATDRRKREKSSPEYNHIHGVANPSWIARRETVCDVASIRQTNQIRALQGSAHRAHSRYDISD
jgi:hypothetical protein